MNLRQRIAACCCAVIILFSTYLSTFPVKPVLAASHGSNCPIPTLGKEVPVLLVHGAFGGPGIWGDTGIPTSMWSKVNSVLGLYIQAFDYHKENLDWVDNPNIGPKLARTIDSLAQASLCTGGVGKVIIVAHSMGGLATRYAAAQTVNGHKVSDEIGLVVTIGTPNFGSIVADVGIKLLQAICDAGLTVPIAGVLLAASPYNCDSLLPAVVAMQTDVRTKLGSLPMLPPSIPLMGIAGRIHSWLPDFDAKITLYGDDTLVPVASAAVGSADTSKGGGMLTINCDAANPFFFGPEDGTCAHGNLPSDPQVQGQVVRSIQMYLASLQLSPTPTPSSGPCPTDAQVGQAIITRIETQGGQPPSSIQVKAGPVCQDDRAGSIVVEDGVQGVEIDDYMNGTWQSEGSGPFMSGQGCTGLPPKITEFFHEQGDC